MEIKRCNVCRASGQPLKKYPSGRIYCHTCWESANYNRKRKGLGRTYEWGKRKPVN